MPRKRQPDLEPSRTGEAGLVVRTLAVRYSHGTVLPDHAHTWHQLIYATEGVMTVHADRGAWVIPAHRAVWVPAGVTHRIEMTGSVLFQTLYLDAGLSDVLPTHCCAVNVSPLLRELIRHAVGLRMLDRSVPEQARLIGVLLDQLSTLPAIPLQLPQPRDRRAVRAAAWIRDHPDDPCSLRALARRSGASVRTLERLFRAETGLTLGRWRQQLRLLSALRLLAAGRPVTDVALAAGYDSPSAFIAMFKRVLGTTPGRYFVAGAAGPGA
jgi:AraC-like DNA-binding protein